MRLVTFAIAATLALTGCPKSGGDSTIVSGNGNGNSGARVDAGTAGDDSDEPLPPDKQLLALLDEIVARVNKTEDCDELASALSSWTNRNKATIDQLIEAITSTVTATTAEEIDDLVVTGYMVVVEAAAECGSNDDAMRAYDAFSSLVKKSPY